MENNKIQRLFYVLITRLETVRRARSASSLTIWTLNANQRKRISILMLVTISKMVCSIYFVTGSSALHIFAFFFSLQTQWTNGMRKNYEMSFSLNMYVLLVSFYCSSSLLILFSSLSQGNPKTTTDIVCKFFIDAIESGRYGWFWECPNGGSFACINHVQYNIGAYWNRHCFYIL